MSGLNEMCDLALAWFKCMGEFDVMICKWKLKPVEDWNWENLKVIRDTNNHQNQHLHLLPTKSPQNDLATGSVPIIQNSSTKEVSQMAGS